MPPRAAPGCHQASCRPARRRRWRRNASAPAPAPPSPSPATGRPWCHTTPQPPATEGRAPRNATCCRRRLCRLRCNHCPRRPRRRRSAWCHPHKAARSGGRDTRAPTPDEPRPRDRARTPESIQPRRRRQHRRCGRRCHSRCGGHRQQQRRSVGTPLLRPAPPGCPPRARQCCTRRLPAALQAPTPRPPHPTARNGAAASQTARPPAPQLHVRAAPGPPPAWAAHPRKNAAAAIAAATAAAAAAPAATAETALGANTAASAAPAAAARCRICSAASRLANAAGQVGLPTRHAHDRVRVQQLACVARGEPRQSVAGRSVPRGRAAAAHQPLADGRQQRARPDAKPGERRHQRTASVALAPPREPAARRGGAAAATAPTPRWRRRAAIARLRACRRHCRCAGRAARPRAPPCRCVRPRRPSLTVPQPRCTWCRARSRLRTRCRPTVRARRRCPPR
eukprot:288373-Chlamydomonas_euryale.AAC.2